MESSKASALIRLCHSLRKLFVIVAFLTTGLLFAKFPTTPSLPEKRPDLETVEDILRQQITLPSPPDETFEERAKRFQRLAEAGDPIAQLGLAALYEAGLGLPKNLEEAVRWLRQAAENGLPFAQNRLGLLYDSGYGVPSNRAEAVHWYRRAAGHGFAPAQFNLALSMTFGSGTETNYSAAMDLFKKAATLGYPPALYQIGMAYIRGRGVETNFAEAQKHFVEATERGVAPAFGAAAVAESDPEKMAHWARRGVEQGDTLSQTLLGGALLVGDGVAKNAAEGLRLLRLAAEKEFPRAQAILGYSYDYGVGMPIDHAEARRLFLAAASKEDSLAMRYLADHYVSGRGVPRNELQAAEWYRKAADAGDAIAQVNHARRLLHGIGTETNVHEAERWLLAAASVGRANAMELLGQMHEKESWGRKDIAKAKEWFSKASEHGSLFAKSRWGFLLLTAPEADTDSARGLAMMRDAAERGFHKASVILFDIYRNGRYGVPEDHREAARWLQFAADKDFAEAQMRLGICYVQGLGVPKDNAQAERLLTRAAEQGNAQAQKSLGLLYGVGGEGFPVHWLKAYKWFRIAERSGESLPPNFQTCLKNLSLLQIKIADRLVDDFFHKPRLERPFEDDKQDDTF